MLNVISKALGFTLAYFIIFTSVFWAATFLMITAQLFFKLFVAAFFIALAVLTFNHFDCANRIRSLFSKKSVNKGPSTLHAV